MSKGPLMPMATAVWLVENTSLTFRQIASFCNLHEVEIRFSHFDAGVRITRYGQVYEKNGNRWVNVTGRGLGQFVAPRTRAVYRSGSHRLHFRIQIRFPESTDIRSALQMEAVTRDRSGNDSVEWADPYGVLVR